MVSNLYQRFDLENGIVSTGSGVSSSNIKDYGNGWYRCSSTFTNANVISLDYFPDFGETEAGYIYIYGAQSEAGSYATSLINTQGSAVTRVSEFYDNGGNDQVINSNEGVLYAEISSFVNTDSYRLISLNNGDSSNNIFFGLRADTGYIYFFIQKDGVTQLSNISSISPLNSMTKIALKFKENDCSCWINGVQIGSTDTSVNLPSGLNRLDMDFGNGSKSYPFRGNVKDLRVYNTALSDAELAALTTI